MEFDKIIHKTLDEESVDYGFMFGNNKIVFIKVGAGGGIPGYQDKYLRMAHRVHERLGATVICASNVLEDEGIYKKVLADMDRNAIRWCVRKLNLSSFELNLVGVSDGANHCLSLARIAPTKKLLCINPSFVPGHDPSDRLILRSKVEKIFVYGTKDDEGYQLVPKLKERAIPNFEIRWVEGADHEFTGMVDEFVDLIDLV